MPVLVATADATDASSHGPLQLEGQLHLALGREGGQLVAPQVERGGGDTVGFGQAEVLVLGGEAGVVPGLVEGLGYDLRVERPGVGEALAPAGHDPDADAGRGGRGQLLDLALVDDDRRVTAPGDEGLHLLAVAGPPGHPGGQLQQLLRAGPLGAGL
jgi:hypothetical protein